MESAHPHSSDIELSKHQLDAFLDLIEQHNAAIDVIHRRQFTRWKYRQPRVRVSMTRPGSTETIFYPATRDLSCQGISLLHGSFVYPNSRITIELPSLVETNKVTKVQGTVVRCVQLRRRVYEIGVHFTDPIDARSIITSDLLNEQYSFETIEPHRLRGTLVYAEDSELDQRLVRHYLRETHIDLVCADSAVGAFEKIKEGCDFVLCDFHLTNSNGFELVRMVRNRMMRVPIVMLTGDPSVEAREQAYHLQINGFLHKPIDQKTLLLLFGEFVLLKQIVQLVEDTNETDVLAQSLRNSFLADLRLCVPKLQTAVQADSAWSAECLCRQISGTAPCVGLDPIGSIAAQTADRLRSTSSIAKSMDLLSQLMQACNEANI